MNKSDDIIKNIISLDGIMNLLLVDDSVQDFKVFLDSVNANTKALRYSSQTDLMTEIAKLGSSFDQVGIVFIKNMTFLGKAFTEQADWFNTMIQTFQVKRVDFLACDTLTDPLWSIFYSKINAVVGASNDRTGNLKYGGDWVMESTGQDIESVYFTKSIEYYKYLLDYGGGYNMFVFKNDGLVYGRGLNTAAQLGLDNNLFLFDFTEVPTPFTIDSSTKLRTRGAKTVIMSGGKLYAAGYNNSRQFGDTLPVGVVIPFTEIPRPVGSLTEHDVAENNTMAIIDGTVYGLGSIHDGQVAFTTKSGLEGKVATKISLGVDHAVVVADGLLYGIGNGNWGQIGQNTTSTTWVNIPLPVEGNITSITCGNQSTFVTIDNVLYSMGRNWRNHLGTNLRPELNRDLLPVQFQGSNMSNVTQVTVSTSPQAFTLVVMNNTLYGVGSNDWNQIGTMGSNAATTFTEMTLPISGTIDYINADWATAFISISGNLYARGSNNENQIGGTSTRYTSFTPVTINGSIATNVTQVRTTNADGGIGDGKRVAPYTMFISNNKLYGIGNNSARQIGLTGIEKYEYLTPLKINGVNATGITKIAGGGEGTIVVNNNILYGAGKNEGNGRIGFDSVTYIPYFKPIPLPVGASGTITHISAGQSHITAVIGGKIYISGSAAVVNRQNLTEYTLPVGASGTIDMVASGTDHSIYLIGGKLYGIGNNANNRIGGNSTSNFTTIQPIDSSTFITSNVTMVSCGSDFTIFTMNNKIYGTGNYFGVLQELSFPSGVPSNTTIDAISAGSSHIAAIFGGKLYGRFGNDYGQIIQRGGHEGEGWKSNWVQLIYNGTPISNATDVKCSGRYTSAVMGGKLYARGDNSHFTFSADTYNVYGSTDWTLVSDNLAVLSISLGEMTPLFGTTGTIVTIAGELFNKIASLTLGGVNVPILPDRTGTYIKFAIPAGNGSKQIVLTDTDGNLLNYPTQFVYRNPIVLSGLSSYTGTKNRIITIYGDDMTNMARVKFNQVYTTSFYRVSNTEYSVIVPESFTGQVIVEDIFGIASTQSITFVYQNTTISSLSAVTGKAGDTLTINGTFLSNTTKVYFGNTEATIVGTPTSNNVVVTIPVELGTVTIRVYDAQLNMATSPQTFEYQIEAVPAGAVQAIVKSSTVDSTKQKYYAILESTNYFVVKYVNATTYTKLYANGTNPITGITWNNDLIYFCDPSSNSIKSFASTTTTMLSSATTVITRGTMVPEAIKTNGTKLFVACKNTGVSTDDSIVILSMAGAVLNSQTYEAMSGYTLKGITYNTTANTTDTSLYVSAVVYPTPSENTGRVFKLDSTGGSPNLTFIQNLTNPIDLTFANGYLIVDGRINIYTATGVLVSSYDTDANTIVTDINVNDTSITFTENSTVTATSEISRITIPPNTGTEFSLTSNYSPVRGPEGTIVSIIGYNMTSADITSVEISRKVNNVDTLTALVANVSYFVSSNLLVVRMPAPNSVDPAVKIIVTKAAGGTQEYVFTYENTNLVNIIPLFDGDNKYFNFTGNGLQNIRAIEFVDATTTTLSSNKKQVRNVTSTSFNCDFFAIPVGAPRCLLEDAFGNVTIEDANYFSLSSETCFLGGTPVLTDQGPVPIEKIDIAFHTLDQKEILAITKVKYNADSLILLTKDCLRKNYPTRDTVISRKHKVYFKGKMKTAESFVGKHKGAIEVPYQNQYLYNVLLKTHEKMSVNGLICETLYPKNPIAKYFAKEL